MWLLYYSLDHNKGEMEDTIYCLSFWIQIGSGRKHKTDGGLFEQISFVILCYIARRCIIILRPTLPTSWQRFVSIIHSELLIKRCQRFNLSWWMSDLSFMYMGNNMAIIIVDR